MKTNLYLKIESENGHWIQKVLGGLPTRTNVDTIKPLNIESNDEDIKKSLVKVLYNVGAVFLASQAKNEQEALEFYAKYLSESVKESINFPIHEI